MPDIVKSSKAGDETGPASRVGSIIKGKWTIDALIGVGGMAAVFAASHRNGQRAALKVLHADFAKEKAICERFLREAYVSNKVNHSATVQVLDDDVTEQGEPFLVMELLEGETVREAWKRTGRTMPAGRVLQICERVVDCLASCHAINVIHRDLKPANIFITKDDEIKVLDFGVAQMRDATSEKTATGTALGTPAYMSPEQAMGLVDQLDGRADLFSVGAMMHALITGHRINSGRTEQEALVVAATKPVPSVARLSPHLPIDLIKAIDKALAWDRRNRFQDAREMQRCLLTLMAAEQTSPLPARPPPRPLEVVAPPAPPLPASFVTPAPPALSTPSTVGLAPALASDQRISPSPSDLHVLPPSFVTEIPESDVRVQTLRDLMKHWDRLLPSVRQFGWTHPATERALRTCYEGFFEALKTNPEVASWTLRPYSLMTLGHTVWEPSTPFDAIPYNLFACGMRTLRIDAGVTFDEMREFFALSMLDPGRDLPPEDDLVAAFWEKALPHVKWESVDAFAEGDAAEREAFYGETDQIESLAARAARNNVNRLEARVMTLSTDDAALGRTKTHSPFSLDEGTRENLLPQLEMTREKWSERYVDALIEGYLDAAANHDAPLVLASLRKSASDFAVSGRLDVALELNRAMNERLRLRIENPDDLAVLASALTNALFGGETLELVLKRLREDLSSLESFAPILSVLGPNDWSTVLAHLRETTAAPLRNVLVAFVERYARGHENEIAQAIPESDPDTVAALVQLLARTATPAAHQALGSLTQASDVHARIEARIHSAPSPEMAQGEITNLLENDSATVRLAALRAITRYQMRNSWVSISRIIHNKTFNDLGNDERYELLRACILLSPERGEPLVLDLAKKGGVLVNESREATRTLAASLLGDLSLSQKVASALEDLAHSRWGTSDETRAAASDAAKRIAQRLSVPQRGSVA
ncbi:MAG: serine/threonine protein kinase [Polyangiaceae bacterium]|nr:serine/threonine protein kinase [Polyangiaceae bacterium]